MMRQLPDAMKAEIREVLDRGGRAMVATMRARAPRKTGALHAGISYRIMASMKLRVGLLGTKRGRARLFYGRIQDLGRKAQTVTVTRRKTGVNNGLRGGRKKAEDVVSVYRLRVRPMAPKRFVTGRMPDLRNMLTRDLKAAWSRALARLAGGGK
ncbi:MAG TPA: hypothetical protein VF442_07560 [Sphingobium sp.]